MLNLVYMATCDNDNCFTVIAVMNGDKSKSLQMAKKELKKLGWKSGPKKNKHLCSVCRDSERSLN